MSYSEKFRENEKIVDKCNELEAYNVGASRAYYCAFIGMKAFLIQHNFNYYKFRIENGHTRDRDYSHGTIKFAMIECFKENNFAFEDFKSFNVIDNLYHQRKIADYYENHVKRQDFENSIRGLRIIKEILYAAD